jgi:hypothetical protein
LRSVVLLLLLPLLPELLLHVVCVLVRVCMLLLRLGPCCLPVAAFGIPA